MASQSSSSSSSSSSSGGGGGGELGLNKPLSDEEADRIAIDSLWEWSLGYFLPPRPMLLPTTTAATGCDGAAAAVARTANITPTPITMTTTTTTTTLATTTTTTSIATIPPHLPRKAVLLSVSQIKNGKLIPMTATPPSDPPFHPPPPTTPTPIPKSASSSSVSPAATVATPLPPVLSPTTTPSAIPVIRWDDTSLNQLKIPEECKYNVISALNKQLADLMEHYALGSRVFSDKVERRTRKPFDLTSTTPEYGLFVLDDIPQWELLGDYEGQRKPAEECEQSASNKLLDIPASPSAPTSASIFTSASPAPNRRYTIDGSDGGNKHIEYINDYRLHVSKPSHPSNRRSRINTAYVLCYYNGVPYMLVITTQFIPGNKECFIDYSKRYWDALLHRSPTAKAKPKRKADVQMEKMGRCVRDEKAWRSADILELSIPARKRCDACKKSIPSCRCHCADCQQPQLWYWVTFNKTEATIGLEKSQYLPLCHIHPDCFDRLPVLDSRKRATITEKRSRSPSSSPSPRPGSDPDPATRSGDEPAKRRKVEDPSKVITVQYRLWYSGSTKMETPHTLQLNEDTLLSKAIETMQHKENAAHRFILLEVVRMELYNPQTNTLMMYHRPADLQKLESNSLAACIFVHARKLVMDIHF